MALHIHISGYVFFFSLHFLDIIYRIGYGPHISFDGCGIISKEIYAKEIYI